MRKIHAIAVAVPLFLSCWLPATAQNSPRSPDRDARRLFQRFIEDAVVTPGGWVEGQFIYRNLPGSNDLYTLGPLIAFRAGNDVEAGIRFGYENFDAGQGPDGSGFSDIDLYGKYLFPGGDTRMALGALLKVPTADEEKRLGTGKPDLELFGAWRANLAGVTLTANAGVRFNGDPDAPLPSSDDSVLLGAGLILPVTPATSFLIEWSFETERVDNGESDSRLTPGFQMMFRGGRGGLRGALGLPLSDGAPDYELIFGMFFAY